jgi:hypothetical protein
MSEERREEEECERGGWMAGERGTASTSAASFC